MLDFERLKNHFGSRLQENIRLANHTTSRVGGLARFFVVSNSADQLASDVEFLWVSNIFFLLLGSGSNVLVSDAGVDAVVLQNRAKSISFETINAQPVILAESGANLGTVSREAAQKSFTGLEWASTIPGTLGGAVYGNAGAHGGEMSGNLILAEILHREKGRLSFDTEQMGYSYRSSILKRQPGSAVILSAKLALHHGDSAEIKAVMQANAEKRRKTQPTGPSMGSMFKNPVGDYAGRLIEAAGLKGTKIGGVEISPIHANFMINNGTANAEEYHRLVLLVQNTVQEKFNIKLDLEIELLGKWQD
ncbi:MAG: UDP-N-acetylmuramate dehydrogenase [Chloroflexi bacterium]|nr:MAG: UDP-N-acetylmuramate dehydrogenase [Chloroflexota bacterium]